MAVRHVSHLSGIHALKNEPKKKLDLCFSVSVPLRGFLILRIRLWSGIVPTTRKVSVPLRGISDLKIKVVGPEQAFDTVSVPLRGFLLLRERGWEAAW